MDSIMEKNLKTFADWFMQQQSEYSRLLTENSEMREELELWHDKIEEIEAMGDLINLIRMLIFNTKDMTDSERVEKIWNAINILYDKYDVWGEKKCYIILSQASR